MSRLYLLFAAVVMSLVGSVGSAQAQTPAVRRISAPLVDPATAWGFYGTNVSHTNGTAALPSAPPEIKALARGLGAGSTSADDYTTRVYEYVRTNISTEFRFGLAKGARGALIDQSGTPFDQAELMVKLLREGGVTATYQIGEISLDRVQFGRWTGLIKNLNVADQTFEVDGSAACQFLADGGIPAKISLGTAAVSGCGDAALVGALPANTTITLGHVWIAAGGKLYDPAFKLNTFKKGINIAEAAGCPASGCGADLTSAAMQGATTGVHAAGVPYIQNVNASGVDAKLATFAKNLEANVQSTLPDAELSDLIGGAKVDVSYQPAVGAALPYPSTARLQNLTEVPDQFRTKVEFKREVAQTYFADELSGRSVHAHWAGLYIDGVYPGSHLCFGNGGDACYRTLTMTARHPYAALSGSYGDETVSFITDDPMENSVQSYFPFAVLITWGNTSADAPEHYAKLRKALDSGIDNEYCAETCLALPTMAAQIASEQSRAETVIGRVTDVEFTRHHTFGIVAENFISVQHASSVQSRRGDPGASASAFSVSAMLSAVLEGAVTQQANDSWDQASAPALLVMANRQGHKFLRVPSAHMASVVNSLTNYTGARKSRLTTAAGEGYEFIVPQNGVVGCLPVEGGSVCTNFGGAFGYKDGSTALLIREMFKGGLPASGPQRIDAVLDVAKETSANFKKTQYPAVDPASGNLTVAPEPDIVTGEGEFPYSLPFKRTYSSNTGSYERYTRWAPGTAPLYLTYEGADADVKTRIGGGWSHNYAISARLVSSFEEAAGRGRGVSASALVAGVHALNELYQSPSFESRLTTAFVGYWVSQATINNAVVVDGPWGSEIFARLPSGAYQPAPGSKTRLVQTNERRGPLIIDSSFGIGVAYDYSQISLTYVDGAGSRITFTPSQILYRRVGGRTFKPDSWVFPDGVAVTFTYRVEEHGPAQDLVLTKVSNNLGRRLDFAAQSSAQGDSFTGWRISAVTDENNRRVSYAWSDCPRFYPTLSTVRFFTCNTLKVTGADNNVMTYGYVEDAQSPNPALITRPSYRLRRWFLPSDQSVPFVTVAYDDIFRVRSTTDKAGSVYQYFVGGITDEDLKRTDQLLPDGVLLTRFFDEKNNLVRSLDAYGVATEYAYDGVGRLISTIFPEGDRVENVYDVRSNLISVIRHPKPVSGQPSALAPIVTSTVYGEGEDVRVCVNPVICNRPTTEIDELGGSTEFKWNATTGVLEQVRAPADRRGLRPQTDLEYQAYGPAGATFQLLRRKIEKIDAVSSVVTEYDYNPSRQYTLSESVVDPAGLALRTLYTFDTVGNPTSIDGPRDDVPDITNFQWDAKRRLTHAISPDPDGLLDPRMRPTVRHRYNSDGQRIATDEGRSNNGSADFVALRTTDFAYDVVGNLVRETTPVSVKQTRYDELDRPLCVAIRMNPAEFSRLPADACVLSPTGAFGPDRVTKHAYDDNGRLVSVLQAFGAPAAADGTPVQREYAAYTYTLNGRQKSVKDANGNVTEYKYDPFDRLWRTVFPSADRGAGASNPADYEEYGYDPAGNRTLLRKRDGTIIRFAYDGLDREWFKDLPATSADPSGVSGDVYKDYDLLGRMLYARVGNDAGPGVEYQYDRAGRVLSETSYGRALSYVYDNWFGDRVNRARMVWPDGVSVQYRYDSLNRISRIEEADGDLLASYAYDDLGATTQVLRADGLSTYFSYADPAYRLTALTHDLPAAAGDLTLGFSYNPASQLVSRTMSNDRYAWTVPGGGGKDYVHDGLNRDQAVAVIPDGYDPNGNQRLSGDGRGFAYDLENRLVTVTDESPLGGGQALVALAYDPLGRLRRTTGAATTDFLFSGDKLIAEYDAGGNLLRRYVHGDGVDEPLVRYEGPGDQDRRSLFSNTQGSIIGASRSSGGESDIYAYGPYGEPASWSGTRFGYTGQVAIPEAKLYYYKARMYDPASGRFLQTDPIGYRDDLNLYAYVGNDPVNKTDPSGTCADLNCVAAMERELKGSPLDTWRGIGAAFVNTVYNSLSTPLIEVKANVPVPKNRAGAKGAAFGVTLGVAAQLLNPQSKARGSSRILALGLEEGLDAFARTKGAFTWKQFANPKAWQAEIVEHLSNPRGLTHVNLTGVDVWGGVSRAASGRGGATDWELLTIRNNPQWWDRIQFWKDGKKVANPFE